MPASRSVRSLGIAVGVLVASLVVAACGTFGSPAPPGRHLPEPTCGGARVEIPAALPCDDVVGIALQVLETETPGQLDRGVVAVTVELQGCPRDEVPPQLDCSGEDFIQLVTFVFGPSAAGGPIEPSLSVGVSPVSGRILGIVNPLIR